MNTKTKNLILGYIVAIVSSMIPAIILGKIEAGIFFIICHSFIRPQFPKEYHHIVPASCRTITASVFFFGTLFILPFEISMLSAIPINYFISWVGNGKANERYYMILCENLKEKYCNDKENLLLKCRKAELSERDTLFALMYFYEHKTPKEIWLWLCQQNKFEIVEWQTVNQTLWRISKKLNNL